MGNRRASSSDLSPRLITQREGSCSGELVMSSALINGLTISTKPGSPSIFAASGGERKNPDRHGFWGYIQTSPRAFWDPMATSPFSEASYCKVVVPRPTHKRGRQSVAHDREPVERAAFRGSDGLEPPKSVTVRKNPDPFTSDPRKQSFSVRTSSTGSPEFSSVSRSGDMKETAMPWRRASPRNGPFAIWTMLTLTPAEPGHFTDGSAA